MMVCIGFREQPSRYVPAFSGSRADVFPGLYLRGWTTSGFANES